MFCARDSLCRAAFFLRLALDSVIGALSANERLGSEQSAGWRSELQGSRAPFVLGGGKIDRVAMLAAIDLGVLTELPLDILAETVPALQVPCAELSLSV